MSAVTRAYFAKNNPVMIIGFGHLFRPTLASGLTVVSTTLSGHGATC